MAEAWKKTQAQSKAQVGALLFDKACTEILKKYSDYNNIFLEENAAELLEKFGINKHAIKLEEDKQSLFRPIYSLSPVELKMLKTYIKTNLANGFICFSKSLTGVSNLFDQKPNRNFCLYMDYRGFNNIIIKN